MGWTDTCRELVGLFPAAVDEYEGLLTDNRIWKQRTVGIGVLPPDVAIDYGITGPMLRGSGIHWDLRKAMPYEAYGEVDFEVPVRHNGDTYTAISCAWRRCGSDPHHRPVPGQAPEGPIRPAAARDESRKESEVYHASRDPRRSFLHVGDGTPTLPVHVGRPRSSTCSRCPSCQGLPARRSRGADRTTDIVLGRSTVMDAVREASATRCSTAPSAAIKILVLLFLGVPALITYLVLAERKSGYMASRFGPTAWAGASCSHRGRDEAGQGGQHPTAVSGHSSSPPAGWWGPAFIISGVP